MKPGTTRLHRGRCRVWLLTLTVLFLWLSESATAGPTTQTTGQTSLRFFGAGAEEPGRVRIPLGPLNAGRITASAPVNVSGDFTIEFWMQATATDNPAPACPNGWYYGHIIVDRDVDGAGDYGDYGIALCDGRLAAGVSVGEDDRQLVSDVVVTDGVWHHIALTRSDGGRIELFVDGAPAGSTDGPAGRVDYRTERETEQPDSDPYLVLGAEKHGYPGSYHYSGFLDDLRISNVARYSGPFSRPAGPHAVDAQTVALYRFDEGSGAFVGDSSGATGGPSHGTLIVSGNPAGPAWSTNTPFSPASPTATAAVETAPAGTSEPIEATVTSEPTTVPPIVTVVAIQSAPVLPTENASPTATTAPTEQAALAAAATAQPSTMANERSNAMIEAPPPASNFIILVLAWIAAAVMIAIAIVARVRQRLRRL